MSLMEQIQKDMYAAMKAGEKEKASALRTVVAKLKDKQIEKRDALTEDEEIKALRLLEKQRKESVEQYKNAGRDELAASEQAEADLIKTYLPQMMDESAIRAIVEEIVADVGAESMSDIGKVMPEVMKRGAGQIDGKQAQAILRELLG
ncbi:MAG: GatB/YqeY domain-containing protein [Candidatus Marinimicrobia bacterium]|nr:GatB/YqeY domain-containing protein [Candidatus Neomarinimicrobiota bacterium]MDP6789084.1 GatB/YqeY domain-containing protein [Candidatus Neomarinimicrobiota bacterium]MDP7071915.1 GatB/YqeY domain-containing protein [Candidatus Neomarinimicrobiota bacterium]